MDVRAASCGLTQWYERAVKATQQLPAKSSGIARKFERSLAEARQVHMRAHPLPA